MRALVDGVPGVNAPDATDFEGFYAFYISQHLHPMTRRAHVLGTTLGIACVAAAIVTGNLWLLLGGPAFGYGFAVPSHFIWEGNKPALTRGVKEALWSIRADLRQVWRFYLRRLDDDVLAVRAALGRSEPASALSGR